MPSLIERITGAVAAFRHEGVDPAVANQGEISQSDPLRLFGGQGPQLNPNALITRKGMEIIDAMRTDDQVKAVMAFKKAVVMATGWEVVQPEDASPEEIKATEFVNWNLDQLRGPFRITLNQIMTGIDYGYSVTEKIYSKVEVGPWAGQVGIEAMKTRRPHSFEFDQDEFGNLKDDGVIQYQTGETARLDKNKFILWTYQAEFQNIYGRPDLEAAYRAWWYKDNAFKWLGMLLERFGIPPLFALYNDSAYDTGQRDRLKKIINSMQAATSGVIPRANKDDLELWSPELAGQVSRVFIPAIEMYDKEIARALLMPSQVGITPEEATGSFARAKVNFDMLLLVAENIRSSLAEDAINDQLIHQLVDLNFEGVENYPEFRWLSLTDETHLELLNTWSTLVTGGIVMPQENDEEHIRANLKMPEPDESLRRVIEIEADDPEDDDPGQDDDDDPPPTPVENRVTETTVIPIIVSGEQRHKITFRDGQWTGMSDIIKGEIPEAETVDEVEEDADEAETMQYEEAADLETFDISYDVRVEDTGEIVTVKQNAKQAMDAVVSKISILEEMKRRNDEES